MNGIRFLNFHFNGIKTRELDGWRVGSLKLPGKKSLKMAENYIAVTTENLDNGKRLHLRYYICQQKNLFFIASP